MPLNFQLNLKLQVNRKHSAVANNILLFFSFQYVCAHKLLHILIFYSCDVPEHKNIPNPT